MIKCDFEIDLYYLERRQLFSGKIILQKKEELAC